jgi:hypothetical protein
MHELIFTPQANADFREIENNRPQKDMRINCLPLTFAMPCPQQDKMSV